LEKAIPNGQVIRFATFEVDLRSEELLSYGKSRLRTGARLP